MVANLVSTTGALIALLALAIALWQGTLVRRQVAHNQNLNRANLYQKIAHLFVEVDMFFVDHPELRPYFYENRPMPRRTKQRHRVAAAAEMFADLAEYCTASEVVLLELSDDWDKYFKHLYASSPALREYWQNYKDYYPDRVRKSFGISKNQSTTLELPKPPSQASRTGQPNYLKRPLKRRQQQ